MRVWVGGVGGCGGGAGGGWGGGLGRGLGLGLGLGLGAFGAWGLGLGVGRTTRGHLPAHERVVESSWLGFMVQGSGLGLGEGDGKGVDGEGGGGRVKARARARARVRVVRERLLPPRRLGAFGLVRVTAWVRVKVISLNPHTHPYTHLTLTHILTLAQP